MKAFKSIALLAYSLIWIGYIFTVSLDDAFAFNRLDFSHMQKKFDLQFFVENGLVPVAYFWMAVIFSKMLFKSRPKKQK